MNWNYSVDFEWFYGVIMLLILVIFNFKKLKNSILIDKFILITFYIYIIAVIAVVLFPIQLFLVNVKQTFPLSMYFNFIPFKTIQITLERNVVQPIGNFLLLLPLGIYIPLLKKSNKLKQIFILGFLTTLTIECLQLLISLLLGVPDRIFDIDDMILNTAGAIAGYILCQITFPYFKSSKNKSYFINRGQ